MELLDFRKDWLFSENLRIVNKEEQLKVFEKKINKEDVELKFLKQRALLVELSNTNEKRILVEKSGTFNEAELLEMQGNRLMVKYITLKKEIISDETIDMGKKEIRLKKELYERRVLGVLVISTLALIVIGITGYFWK